MLRHGADPSIHDKIDAQPLFRAAGLTYVEAVKVLIKAGAIVDGNDHYGKTALHGHFHDDNVKIPELLLDAGPTSMTAQVIVRHRFIERQKSQKSKIYDFCCNEVQI